MVSATQSGRRSVAVLGCAVVLAASCAREQPDEVGISQRVAGVIISVSAEDARRVLTVSGITDTWTPSDAQVANVERSLRAYLEKAARSASGDRVVLERLLEEMGAYRRQYYGIVTGSNKCVRCVFAIGTADGQSWKTAPLDIHDGKGFEFSYDPEDGSVHDFFLTSSP